jgi:AraC-like DNA-binding protein
MDSWIDRRLLDPDISAAAMAADHAVSVRTVHRLLSKEGDTFSAVVRRRRLDRAREELADGDRAITVIAARWGFADASHFSRSFKDAFGISPREYRAGRAARHGSLLVDG